jgi:hypothetical protein
MSAIAGIMSWAVRLRTGLSANSALGGAARPTRRTASTRPIVVLVLCGAFLIALVVGVIALILSNLRHHAIEQSKQQLLATATVLARQAARDFQSIDLIEANLIEYMETLAIVSDELYARAMVGRGIHLMLKDKISGFPHIGAVMLIGADGGLINSSQAWPTSPLNFAGQDYFEALKASPRLGSMLGEPTRDRQTGAWTIYFARKFRGSNGEFLGLVVGTVASQYFEESYATLARGTDVSKVSANLRTLDDLKGRTVVSTIASTNLKQISELNAQRHLGLTIVAAKDNFEAFRMLESDRAAAHFIDDILLYGAVANSATPADYVVSDEALSAEPYGILLPRDDAAFKKVADDALAATYRSGEINTIYAKWFLNPIPPNSISLNVPMSPALKRVIEHPTDSGDPEAYAMRNAAH